MAGSYSVAQKSKDDCNIKKHPDAYSIWELCPPLLWYKTNKTEYKTKEYVAILWADEEN